MADLNARIKPKKSSTAGEAPQAADLEVAEIAVNTADGKLFVKHTDNSIKEISGGAVGSVNGQTGAVVLDLEDLDNVLDLAAAATVYQFTGTNTGTYPTQAGGEFYATGSSTEAWFDDVDANGADFATTALTKVIGDPIWISTDGVSFTQRTLAAEDVVVNFGANKVRIDVTNGWPNSYNGGSLNDVYVAWSDPGVTAPTDGQVLTWVDANSQWEPANIGATTPAPGSPGQAGTAGEIKYDSNYIYVAVADNTWKRALLDTWVPAGTIAEVLSYTGNGGTQSITGAGFQPGLIFIRKPGVRVYVVSEAASTLGHFVWGNGGVTTGGVTSLDADGFSLGANDDVNQSGVNYTAIVIKTGQSLTDNTGTIPFNYYRIGGCNHGTYSTTGNSSSTYGHGLSVAPEFFANKRLGNAQGYISGNTLGPTGKSLYLAGSYFYVNSDVYSTLNSTVVSAGNNNVNPSGGAEAWSLFCENVGTQTACNDITFGGTQTEEVNLGFTPRLMIMREYTPQTSTTTSGQYPLRFYYNSTLDATGFASLLNIATEADGVSSFVSWTANGFSIAANGPGNKGATRALFMAFR